MAMNSRVFSGLRCAACGLVLGAAGLAAVGQTSAQAISGHDSNAPVSFGADRIDLQDRQNRVVLAGNVVITQGDMHLQAARTTVAYVSNGGGVSGGGLKIERVDASGGVTVTRGNESATGDVAVYDFNRRIITMVGNVALRRGGDRLAGGRLVMDLASGVSTIDGQGSGVGGIAGARRSGGRVSGTFSVAQHGN